MDSSKHVLTLLVDNDPGVLQRVVGLISRRGFNIESLSVGPTENPALSHITLVALGDEVSFEQITKQLHKLVPVHKITDLSGANAIVRELALFKIQATAEKHSEIIQIANIFRAKIIDIGTETMVIELTGTQSKIDAICEMLSEYDIVEVARTGAIALSRGATPVKNM